MKNLDIRGVTAKLNIGGLVIDIKSGDDPPMTNEDLENKQKELEAQLAQVQEELKRRKEQ